MVKKLTDGSEWGIRDLLLNLMVVFLALSCVALVSVVAKKKESNQQLGAMVITMVWDNTSDSDVDLWIQTPGDPMPVGYMRRKGKDFDLLHDFRGFTHEGNYSNTEFAVSRNLPDGEYYVNSVMYQHFNGPYPVWVKVTVSLRVEDSSIPKEYTDQINMVHDKQETTMLMFRVKDNKIIDDSVIQNPPQYQMFGGTP
jgi:hypothetical protein